MLGKSRPISMRESNRKEDLFFLSIVKVKLKMQFFSNFRSNQIGFGIGFEYDIRL
jgi:hypothetical protein